MDDHCKHITSLCLWIPVDLIAAEALSEVMERVRAEGWAWVEAFESMGYEERQRFCTPPQKYLAEGAPARQQREQLEKALQALDDQCEALCDADDQNDEKFEALEADSAQLRAKLTALLSARVYTSGYDRAILGSLVTTEDGVLKITRQLRQLVPHGGQVGQERHDGRCGDL